MYAEEKDLWKDFARDAARLNSPLYAALALGVDGDAELKGLAARRRKGQPPSNLLFAAVHYLLLRGADHPLRSCYATLGGTRPTADAFSLFRDFALSHRAEIQALVETRVTNTNEVNRSAVLRAGFGALAAADDTPLHLIEIGPSAGLNLIWDRYSVDYLRGTDIAARVMPDAALRLSCALKGALPPVNRMPPILSRLGLERDPVDLTDDRDRDWLRAVIWGDQSHRLARLESAIAMFLETPLAVHPGPIRAGDALDLLPGVLAGIPGDDPVCVYHTIAVYQFSAAMRETLHSQLAAAGLRRPVWHLAFEFDGSSDYVLTLTRHRNGEAHAQRLGLAQPHGGWIAWSGA
jgi:hypothetical protein